MSIDYQREDYLAALPDWQLGDDATAGATAVKKAGSKYLPYLNPADTSQQNKDRNQDYITRAIYYNATRRTLDTLMGQVFRKPLVVELQGRTKALEEDVDGAGLLLSQQVQKVCRDTLKTGRVGLYVDYPVLDSPASLADNITASINVVDAEAVHNWKIKSINGTSRLTLVTIFEIVEEGDEMEPVYVDQYRALRLIEGTYTVEIWRKDEGDWLLFESHIPRKANGMAWDEIPFIFVGATNNHPDIDDAPLLDIANINIAHYRNSADYEDSVHVCGQPQSWIAGLSEEWRDWLHNSGVYVGSRTTILLPENGSFGIAQAQPNTLAKEAMLDKERQMIALGARLIVKGEAVKTVDQARSENEAQHSVLSLVVENVETAYTQALEWAGLYMGDEGGFIEINRDFLEAPLDAQMLSALTAAWTGGLLPDTDVWDVLRKAGLIDPEKTDEQLREELIPVDLTLDQ